MNPTVTLAMVKGWIEDNTPEGLHLEFKTAPRFDGKQLDKDSRRALGECLSAFSNSDGGVVVWGIETSKIGGVDRATKILGVPFADRFFEQIQALQNEYLSPQNQDVVPHLIQQGENKLVVLEIQKGKQRPYMSRAPGHLKYFRRTSESCVPLEHYEVIDLVNARAAPSLVPRIRFARRSTLDVEADVYVENRSGFIAKLPFASIDLPGQGPSVCRYGIDGNGRFPWRLVPGSNWKNAKFSAGSDDVVHVDQEVRIAMIKGRSAFQKNHPGHWSVEKMDEEEAITIKVGIACEGMQLTHYLFEVSKSDFENLASLQPKKVIT